MTPNKPEIPFHRVESRFLSAPEPYAAEAVPAPPVPARARRWVGVLVGAAVVFALAGGGAYWAKHRMSAASQAAAVPALVPSAKPPVPVQAANPAASPQPPASPPAAPPAPPPAPATAAPPGLIEGTAPLLAQPPRWEHEVVVAPPARRADQ